jgi:hypothetical protein
MIVKNKKDYKREGITSILTGIAVAGAFILKDKKNRDEIKKSLTGVKDKAMNYLENVQKKTDKKAKEENLTN